MRKMKLFQTTVNIFIREAAYFELGKVKLFEDSSARKKNLGSLNSLEGLKERAKDRHTMW